MSEYNDEVTQCCEKIPEPIVMIGGIPTVYIPSTDDLYSHFIEQLLMRETQCVVFDLDCTACIDHSGGVMDRLRLQNYINNPSTDFVRITKMLLSKRIKVGIATFCDEAYYERGYDKNAWIAGEELVECFLKNHLTEDERSLIKVVATNPKLHGLKIDKNSHMEKLAQKFEITLEHMILFDDSQRNVEAADGFTAYQVKDTEVGFQLSDMPKS